MPESNEIFMGINDGSNMVDGSNMIAMGIRAAWVVFYGEMRV
jgi:hypothetical protein